MEHPPWIESIYFLSSNGENFQPGKSTRFDHRGQRTLVVVLKGLTASKSQAAGKQVDGKNSWRDAEGEEDSNCGFVFFPPVFFSSTDHLISDISSTARQHPHPGFPIISTPQARESSLETLQVPCAELVGGTHAMKNPRRLPDKCLIPDDFPWPC